MQGNREQVQQPLVVVSALFLCGVVSGWALMRFGLLSPLNALYAALFVVLFSAILHLWRGFEGALIALIFSAGLFVVALSTVQNGDIYERSSLLYFKSQKTEKVEKRESSTNYIDYRYAFPKSWGERANNWARERIEELSLSKDDEQLAVAMLLGRKGGIDSELRSSYSRSGAAHLLAVSGLHLGVIFLIANLLLKMLNLLYRGHLLRNILVVVIIWLYAYIVGMSASVVRAATMFSILQLALLTARQYSSLNALAAAIIFMVGVDVKCIFDIGFLLSITAVAAILLWALPLWGILCSEYYSKMNYVVRFVGLSLIIGLVCSIATAPLVGYAFGYFTLWGVLLSPLVTITLTVVLISVICWVFLGFAFLAPLFRVVVESAMWLQNGAVRFISSGWSDARSVQIDEVWVVVAYLFFAIFTILFRAAVIRYYRNRGQKWYDGVELKWGADVDWDILLEDLDTMYEHEQSKIKRYD